MTGALNKILKFSEYFNNNILVFICKYFNTK